MKPTPPALSHQAVLTKISQSDIFICISRTDPGYSWGSSIQREHERVQALAGGECATLQELESQLENLLSQIVRKDPGVEFVLSCGGGPWKDVSPSIALPSNARYRHESEAFLTGPHAAAAEQQNPGVISKGSPYVATDGSVSKFNGHAGYGWVSDCGAFGLEKLGVVKDVCHAELAAMESALRVTSHHSHPTFLVDSSEAIDLIQKQVTLGSFGYATNQRRKKKLAQIDRSPIRNARLQKVAAHSGHVLNEAADRIAKLARRASESGMSDETMWGLAAGIRDETLAALSDQHRKAA